MPRVLNVGGHDKRIPIPPYYRGWEHLILDIDPAGNPDICLDAREMGSLPPATCDAIYCAHNLEHYFPHDLRRVLSGFAHVLTPDGFVDIRVPDLGAVMKAVAERNLDIEDPLYFAEGAGFISVRDVIYGFARQIETSGVDFYAHKNGFTAKSLRNSLLQAGFKFVTTGRGSAFELAAVAFLGMPTAEQQQLLGFRV